jgi:SagB-type dehydrogenase family enzyme
MFTGQSYQLNPSLVVTFADDGVRAHLPADDKRFRLDAQALELIAALSDKSRERLNRLSEIYDGESLDRSVQALATAGIVVPADGTVKDGTVKDGTVNGSELIRGWRNWGESSWFMYLSSRDAKYATTHEQQLQISADIAASDPPPIAKCLCDTPDPSLDLPEPRTALGTDITDALLQRRTCRNFTDEEIDRQALADVLFYTGGSVFKHPTNFFGDVLKKCAPSPGARHATEIYPVIQAVRDVPAGIYHYCALHHAITRVQRADLTTGGFLTEALQQQDYFSGAAVTCVFTAVTERVRWKYRQARAFRLMHYETGHYAQNLLLTSTALGLGAFVTGALADSFIERALRLDGTDEIVMYAAGFGPAAAEGPYRRDGVQISQVIGDTANLRLPAPMPDLPDIPDDLQALFDASPGIE